VSIDPTTRWFKSSKSLERDTCVEVAHLDNGLVGVRDSTNPTGPALVFTPTAWDAFTTSIRHGRLDLS
jgi:hypothetical protein